MIRKPGFALLLVIGNDIVDRRQGQVKTARNEISNHFDGIWSDLEGGVNAFTNEESSFLANPQRKIRRAGKADNAEARR